MKENIEKNAGQLPYESPGIASLDLFVEQGFAQSDIEDPKQNYDPDFWN